MKKTFLIAVFAVFAASSTYAQGIGFGVKGGLNFANQNYDTEGLSLSPDSKTGFHAGVFLPVMFSDNFGLQPELLFSTKGSKLSFSGVESKTSLSYVEIPILFRYQPIEILSLNAGPQFGILTSAEAEVSGGGVSETEDIKDALKGSDLGFSFGGQVELPMGFVGGLRYTLGLSDINDDADADGVEIRNRTFQLFVGWKFL